MKVVSDTSLQEATAGDLFFVRKTNQKSPVVTIASLTDFFSFFLSFGAVEKFSITFIDKKQMLTVS